MLQRDAVSTGAEGADGPSLGVSKSGETAATLNNVGGSSRCSVETSSGAGGASGITADCDGSEAGASRNGAGGSGSIKYENETGSGSRADSTSSDWGGSGTSILEELGVSPRKVDDTPGSESASERKSAVGGGTSDPRISGVSAIDPFTSFTIER